jgi:hypothetical protein
VTSVPNRIRVLILAREPIIAALLGLLVESERFEPIFAQADERPEDAVARVRPPLILMLDCTLDAARSDIFFAKAARVRARIVLVEPPRVFDDAGAMPAGSIADVEQIARARGVPWLDLRADHATITRCLEQLADGLA